MGNINVEGFNWTVAVHSGWTKDKFVGLYNNDDHRHIYEGMKPEQKTACLLLAWEQINALNPAPELEAKAEKKK